MQIEQVTANNMPQRGGQPQTNGYLFESSLCASVIPVFA